MRLELRTLRPELRSVRRRVAARTQAASISGSSSNGPMNSSWFRHRPAYRFPPQFGHVSLANQRKSRFPAFRKCRESLKPQLEHCSLPARINPTAAGTKINMAPTALLRKLLTANPTKRKKVTQQKITRERRLAQPICIQRSDITQDPCSKVGDRINQRCRLGAADASSSDVRSFTALFAWSPRWGQVTA